MTEVDEDNSDLDNLTIDFAELGLPTPRFTIPEAREQPWLKQRISRATWYRRHKAQREKEPGRK